MRSLVCMVADYGFAAEARRRGGLFGVTIEVAEDTEVLVGREKKRMSTGLVGADEVAVFGYDDAFGGAEGVFDGK